MAVSLFRHEQIKTTLPKAKELRRVAEPLITLAKNGNVANRRLAFSRLRDREIVGKLFTDLGIRFKDRPGGYLRILKAGHRSGDKAQMAIVQLVERSPAIEPETARRKTTGEEPEATTKKKKAAKTVKAEQEPKKTKKTKAKKEKKVAAATKKKKVVKSTTKKASKKKARKTAE